MAIYGMSNDYEFTDHEFSISETQLKYKTRDDDQLTWSVHKS